MAKCRPKGYAKLDSVYRTKEEMQTMLVATIHWRFQTPDTEQAQIAQQLAQINDLQQLTELSEHFLQMAILAEFTKPVVTYLSSPILNNVPKLPLAGP